jgi:LPXTG-motif cell wall-anchored protein
MKTWRAFERVAACLLVAGSTGVIAMTESVGGAAPAKVAQARTLTVAPDEFLADGDTVDVHVTGAAPNELLVIFECNRPDPPEKTDPAPNALNYCLFAPGTYKTANADDAGVLDTTFTVTEGTVSSLGNDVTIADVAYIFVANTTERFADGAPFAEITFGEPVTPTATVAPAIGLHDGDVVTVTWSGFPAGQPVAATQCTGTEDPTDAGQCDLENFVQGMSDASGTGSVQVTVHTGAIAAGGGTCDSDHQCVILVADFGGVSRAVATLSFAAGAPTTAVTTPTTATTMISAASESTGTSGDRGTSELPRTGSAVIPLAVAGVSMLLGGVAALAGARRRAAKTTAS